MAEQAPTEQYPPRLILTEIAENLTFRHNDLRVGLSNNHFTHEEGLSATLECVRGFTDRNILPTTNPARRERLRRMALEMRKDLEETKPFSSARRIRTSGRLTAEDMPAPLSPARRALLKQRFLGENEPPFRKPYVLVLSALLTEQKLAAIVGNAKISAVDWEPDMPQCILKNVEMLWDTGAASTIITTDLLDEKFRSHLSDPIHEAYHNSDGTRVQLSFVLEFTNSVFKMDIIAWAVDKAIVPNQRSGIILGQNGFIDAIQHRSVPRTILEAQGQVIDESLWGDLIVESFIDVDGSLKEL